MTKQIIRTLFMMVLLQVIVILISGCGEQTKIKGAPNSTLTRPPTPTPTQTQQQSQTQPQNPTPTPIISPSMTSNEPSKPPESLIVQTGLEVPILYYHSVMLEEGNEVRMPPDQFEAQMAYMRNNGYESITLNQLYQAFYKGGTLPAKPFVITFDDGYADNYTTAFPIVRKHGFTAAVFMVSSYIGGKGFLSWSQLKELTAAGWEIEGHTVNHPYLSKMDKKTLFNELRSSKEVLESGLGKPVSFFAYPYGDVNTDIARAVKETGYAMAFTTDRGWADLNLDEWRLQRVYCFANMGLSEFSRRLQSSKY